MSSIQSFGQGYGAVLFSLLVFKDIVIIGIESSSPLAIDSPITPSFPSLKQINHTIILVYPLTVTHSSATITFYHSSTMIFSAAWHTSTILLAALTATASTATAQDSTGTNSTTYINSAVYDGTCYYPTGDSSFDLESFLGRWYQVAGTVVPFTLGCSCTYAEYALNTDGSVNVTNSCQIGILPNNIAGTATIVDEAYGTGALQVSFDIVPDGGVICPGPNYIVQKYTEDWAIVQSPLWSTLFLLTRNQNATDVEINTWLSAAEALGTNLSLVTKVSQENCLYT